MYIASQEELEAFVSRAASSEVLAIDTEFLREKTYYPKLCLLQLATEEESVIVDPLASLDLKAIVPLLEDERIVKLFHAGYQDLEIILREIGVLPRPIFDTQVACEFLGMRMQVGYGALVEAYEGVHLDKADSLTDWSRRPLDARQLEYAADDVRYLPTDQLLIPDFTATQSPYQRASTEFDAYAQAVESLWSVGGTDESRAYARRALDLMKAGDQMLGSYWAGRAIDISRTTAAHALSYYMTATYGIPHGHAVYMMFPYVCRANGHPEFIREVPELQSLRAFAAEKGLDWDGLVGKLLANVNPARLANNPAPIDAESFRFCYHITD